MKAILLVFSFLFSSAFAENLHLDYKDRPSAKMKLETLNYIYQWIYRISNPKYFNQKYFKDSILDGKKGLFILNMSCVKDYYGEFYLKIKNEKYLRKVSDKYRYIPISKIDPDVCKLENEVYIVRLFEKIVDKVMDVKNNRTCYLSALTFCVEGRKKACEELVKPSYICVKNKD